MSKYIYLDNAATTKIDPLVLKEMKIASEEIYGNSESVHKFGVNAHKTLESARKIIANLLHVHPQEIIFTSGGTESDNMAIFGTARKMKALHPDEKFHIITSEIEHPAVLNSCKQLEKEGFDVSYIPVDKYGMVRLQVLRDEIKENTILASIMHSNNEIGTIQPIEEIGRILKEHNILFHTDAVQSFGKELIDVKKCNIDMLSVSAHKIHGPKGVGLLYLKNCGRRTPVEEWIEDEVDDKDYYIQPLIFGGGHEFGWRPSTVNVPSIVGFAKAVELMYSNHKKEQIRQRKMQQDLIKWVSENIKDVKINGHPTKRVANNINFSIKDIEGNQLFLGLNLEKIAVSTGSACSTQAKDISHVIRALKMEPEYAKGTIRISLGRFTTEQEIEKFKLGFKKVVSALRLIHERRRNKNIENKNLI